MEVASFAVDPSRNAPLIILKETGGDRTLPIPIGAMDASAIAIKSLNVVTDKPLTIDLVSIVMVSLGARLDRVVIEDTVEKGLSARLHVVCGSTVHLIECATSDAISLALRCPAPVFVSEDVLAKRKPGDRPTPQEDLRKHIAALDTLDFGRYFPE